MFNLVSLANVFWSCVFFTEDDEEIKHGEHSESQVGLRNNVQFLH